MTSSSKQRLFFYGLLLSLAGVQIWFLLQAPPGRSIPSGSIEVERPEWSYTVVAVDGAVKISAPEGVRELQSGDRVMASAEVVTEGGGRAILEASGFARLALAPGSRLRFGGDPDRGLFLSKGAVQVSVWNIPGGDFSHFRLETPNALCALDTGGAHEFFVLVEDHEK